MVKRALKGRVAVVAGATRGAGRGIAAALGEQGATVYCTGRSAGGRPSPMRRPETIKETAELVEARGGVGIAVRVDHSDEAQVKRLFRKVDKESGRLDVLVNDIWGGDPLTQWGKPFWQLPAQDGLALLEGALFTHLITARHGVPLMVRRRRGLLVELTDGDTWQYRGNLYYDLAKAAVVRLAFDMAEELRAHRIASVAITPGFMRSEAVLDHFGVTEANWREGGRLDPNFLHSETPLFVGRAVAALSADARVLSKSGRLFSSWGLSRAYGFKDADGRRPDWGRHVERDLGGIAKPLDDEFYAYWDGYERMRAAFKMP